MDKDVTKPVPDGGLQDSKHGEPLTARLNDDQVAALWFFVGKENRLARGGPATGQFVSRGHDFFACLSDETRVHDDFAMIEKLRSRRIEE